MPIRLHKKEERPQPPAVESARPRVSKVRGFPRFVLWLLIAVVVVLGAYYAVTWNKIQVRGRVIAGYSVLVAEGLCRVSEV